MNHKPSIKAAMARQRRETISAYWLAGYDSSEAGMQIHGIDITPAEYTEIVHVFMDCELPFTIVTIEPRGEQYDRRKA